MCVIITGIQNDNFSPDAGIAGCLYDRRADLLVSAGTRYAGTKRTCSSTCLPILIAQSEDQHVIRKRERCRRLIRTAERLYSVCVPYESASMCAGVINLFLGVRDDTPVSTGFFWILLRSCGIEKNERKHQDAQPREPFLAMNHHRDKKY